MRLTLAKRLAIAGGTLLVSPLAWWGIHGHAAQLIDLADFADVGEVAMAQSGAMREMHPQVTASDRVALSFGNAQFALDLYKQVAKQAGAANAFISPYSTSYALTMTLAGARGETATQMAAVLHHTLTETTLDDAFNDLDLDLGSRSGEGIVLRTASALWCSRSEQVEQPFIERLARNYGAGVGLMDFVNHPGPSRRQINAWVDLHTEHKISNLLDSSQVTSNTRLVITNAAYFHGDWRHPFKKKDSRPGRFVRPDGSVIQVPTMDNINVTMPAARTSEYDAVEVAYEGERLAMDIVMPKSASLSTFESALTTDRLIDILSSLKKTKFQFIMPRFAFGGTTFSLRETLISLGMDLAFTPGADFSAMAPHVFIGQVLQQASITVDEKGTEAVAATAEDTNVGAAWRPLEMIHLDHPFFFALRDLPTGTILFAGRLTDPSKSE